MEPKSLAWNPRILFVIGSLQARVKTAPKSLACGPLDPVRRRLATNQGEGSSRAGGSWSLHSVRRRSATEQNEGGGQAFGS